MTYIIFFLITTILQILLFNNATKIANYIKLVDNPDNLRKFHKSPVPLIGGLILSFTLFLNLIFLKILDISFTDNIFIYFIPLITIVGLIDDKYDLSANIKFLILILLFFIFFYFDKNLILEELRFSSFLFTLNISVTLSFPLTILCCLLLLNSINMIDGKNGLCSSIQLIILSFIAFYIIKEQYLNSGKLSLADENLQLIFLYATFLIIFLFFNLKGSIFLGDAGAYLGSFIIIYLILNIYSQNSIVIKCEQIFLLLILPGIDMLRVFIFRLMNKKSPFEGDNQHFHHLLERIHPSHKIITLIMIL